MLRRKQKIVSEEKKEPVEAKKREESPLARVKRALQRKATVPKINPLVEETITKLDPKYFQDRLQELKLKARAAKVKRHVAQVKEVKSKLARYYIIDTYLHSRDQTPLLDVIARWQKEVQGILTRLHTQAVGEYKTPQDQAHYFALLCTQYLLLGKEGKGNLDTLSDEFACPYKDRAWNFILPLIQGKRCLCLCYATYIRAAAEEFDYTDYLYLCNEDNNSSIVAVDEHKLDTYIVTKNDVAKFSIAGSPTFLHDKNIVKAGSRVNISRILTRITVRFIGKVEISITSRQEEKSLVERINPKLVARVTYVENVAPVCDKVFLWNDEVTLVSRIVTRVTFKVMYAQLLCVGYIYDLEPLIDYMLLLHLLYMQKQVEHYRWEEGVFVWDDYNSILSHLQNLIDFLLDDIYNYMTDRVTEPFSVSAMLTAVDRLTAKAKSETLKPVKEQS